MIETSSSLEKIEKMATIGMYDVYGICFIAVFATIVLLWRRRKDRGNVEDGHKSLRFASEKRLYDSIRVRYPDAVSQQRFPWLGRQSLDIYIPSKKTAIEYQGEQHYRSVEIFGGRKQYRRQRNLDRNKKRLCKKHRINLLYFSYKGNAPGRLYWKKIYKSEKELFRKLRWL